MIGLEMVKKMVVYLYTQCMQTSVFNKGSIIIAIICLTNGLWIIVDTIDVIPFLFCTPKTVYMTSWYIQSKAFIDLKRVG